MNNHSEYFLSACFRTLLLSKRDQFQSLSSSREKLLVYAPSTTTRQEKRTQDVNNHTPSLATSR